MQGAKHNRLMITKLMVFAGCLAISWMSTATTAAAHVKWFVNCNVSDEPLPVRDVFTARFFFCATLFLAVFYVACEAEESAVGVAVSRLLDRWTAPLHRRTEDLLRAAAAISFALLWADGSLILTPELKGRCRPGVGWNCKWRSLRGDQPRITRRWSAGLETTP